MTEQSTNEGQQESILEQVFNHQEGNETGGNLAPGLWVFRALQNGERIGIRCTTSAIAECTAPHQAGRIAR